MRSSQQNPFTAENLLPVYRCRKPICEEGCEGNVMPVDSNRRLTLKDTQRSEAEVSQEPPTMLSPPSFQATPQISPFPEPGPLIPTVRG